MPAARVSHRRCPDPPLEAMGDRMPSKIIGRVKDFIEGNHLLEKGDMVLLSLSAGKDSMALLDIMRNIREDPRDLAIFHLNHMMRGEESEGDEAFLRERAGRYGILIFTERFDFTRQEDGRLSFEERAREKRYELLERLRMERGFSKIATAHTRSDHAETILMRIFGGTGLHGLRGIPPRRGPVIRPLLALSSEEVRAYLKERNITWREDSSNAEDAYLRNYARNRIIPVIRGRFPSWESTLFRLGEHAAESESLLGDLLAEKYQSLYEEGNGEILIDCGRYLGDPRLLKHVLAVAVREGTGGFVGSGMLAEIVRKAGIDRANMVLFEDRDIVLRKTRREGRTFLILSRRFPGRAKDAGAGEWEERIDLDPGVSFPGGKRLYLREIGAWVCVRFAERTFFEEYRRDKNHIFVALEGPIDYIVIRNRRRGDRIKLAQGSKKIKEILIEKKLDNQTKTLVPHLVINSDIAALMTGFVSDSGNRVSEDYRVEPRSKKILAIYRLND